MPISKEAYDDDNERVEIELSIFEDVFNSKYKGKNKDFYKELEISVNENKYVTMFYIDLVNSDKALSGAIDIEAVNLIKKYTADINSEFANHKEEGLKSNASFDSYTCRVMVGY
jgi:hypothetical protein